MGLLRFSAGAMGQAILAKCSRFGCRQSSWQAEMAEEEARHRKEEEQRREACAAVLGAGRGRVFGALS